MGLYWHLCVQTKAVRPIWFSPCLVVCILGFHHCSSQATAFVRPPLPNANQSARDEQAMAVIVKPAILLVKEAHMMRRADWAIFNRTGE